MFSPKLLAVVTPFLLAVGATPTDFMRPRAIEALLRSPPPVGSALKIRQAGSCDAGYLPCSDGQGCCPVGEYCGEWGGKLGCCPNGKTCVANNNPCDFQGYLPCQGEDFCCPSGYTCFRDSTNSPKCAPPGSGGGSSGGSGGGSSGSTTSIGGGAGAGGAASSSIGGIGGGTGASTSGGLGGGSAPTTSRPVTVPTGTTSIPQVTVTNTDLGGNTSPTALGSSANGAVSQTVSRVIFLILGLTVFNL